MKWKHLLESEASLRKAERDFLAHSNPGTRDKLIREWVRSGPGDAFYSFIQSHHGILPSPEAQELGLQLLQSYAHPHNITQRQINDLVDDVESAFNDIYKIRTNFRQTEFLHWLIDMADDQQGSTDATGFYGRIDGMPDPMIEIDGEHLLPGQELGWRFELFRHMRLSAIVTQDSGGHMGVTYGTAREIENEWEVVSQEIDDVMPDDDEEDD